VTNFLPANDCLATVSCLQALGVIIEENGSTSLSIQGGKLVAPQAPLNCARSGTTMRLLTGILAAQPFDSTLTGDEQLLRRPMRRIVAPLRHMSADITDTDGHAPLHIHGHPLEGCTYRLDVASAQVKSALLLAGLNARGTVVVEQPGPARDHTERMLAAMGARIEVSGNTIRLHPPSTLSPLTIDIPGDISSAAFPLVAAVLVPGTEVIARDVGINQTRTGLLDVLQAMGANIQVTNARELAGEPVGDVRITGSDLCGTTISGDTVVRMIDEFPILAVAATQAEGTTVIREAAELRVKETDRIATATTELQKLGAQITPTKDGFIVRGRTILHGGTVDSHGDHRLAMALVVAGIIAKEDVIIQHTDCIPDSFPGFIELMKQIGARCD
jgi:3-phosphoshikimate 1-carboxyvinyltransferase